MELIFKTTKIGNEEPLLPKTKSKNTLNLIDSDQISSQIADIDVSCKMFETQSPQNKDEFSNKSPF